jgi:PAS domain S-box-containing protein
MRIDPRSGAHCKLRDTDPGRKKGESGSRRSARGLDGDRAGEGGFLGGVSSLGVKRERRLTCRGSLELVIECLISAAPPVPHRELAVKQGETRVRSSRVGELRLTGAGALVDVDDVGAEMLGFGTSSECLAELRGKVFATQLGAGAAAGALEGAARFVAECRGAGGRTLSCELHARLDGQGILALLAPLEQEGARASSLESIIGSLPNPLFVKDARHRWIILNDSCCQLVGWRREELLGKSDFDVFPRSEAEVFWAKDDEVFATGRTNENEELITDSAGRTHVILTRKSLHRDELGRPILLGVITDITERKQAEEALRRSHDELDRRVAMRTSELERANAQLVRDAMERRRASSLLQQSEEKFRHLADALPQIVWTALPNGEVDYINSRGPEYAGVLVKDALRHRWLEFVHPDDRKRVWERWEQSLRSGEVYECEYRLRRHDGVYRWQLVRALPLPDEQGRVERWFGTATDLEDEKRAQEAMQEEDRRKNDFLAMLSHELRNPLTPIRNATGLLLRMAPGTPGFDRARTILERQVALLARLIDDLLDLSRITRGKIVLKKERFDLAALVRTLVDDRRESLEADDLLLELKLPDETLSVEGDPARVAQAIGNLLDNAERYTDRGGVVHVEAGAEGGMVVLVVRDTGIGLGPAALQHVFTPFVQVGGRRGGLGLGLSLVKYLAELHAGSVEAHSEGEGRGSTFVFRLPLAARPPVLADVRPPGAPPAPAGGRRVLVVEDNADAAESLRLMLQLDGHEVEVAATGEEGLARARAARPDVVICDIGLPGISGYDLARSLRADPSMEVRLVAVTGYGQPQDREDALRSGFEHHLTKPYDHDDLQKLLADLGTR